MSTERTAVDGVWRRTILKASAVAAGALALSPPVIATAKDENDEDDERDVYEDNGDVDEPHGFEVELFTGHSPFPDELAVTFSHTFAGIDHDDPAVPIGAHQTLDGESTLIVGEARWEPGGTSGWHHHPGVALIAMVEGAIEITWEFDCVPRTYAAGDGWFDPGIVHNADNASDDEPARAIVTFLGIPDGEPATTWVEPVEC